MLDLNSRSPSGTVINEEFPELIGVEAYLNAGDHLKKLLTVKEQSMARDLLAECINGVVQSETFFFSERGFADAEAVLTHWDEIYVNSCFRFSHPDFLCLAHTPIKMPPFPGIVER